MIYNFQHLPVLLNNNPVIVNSAQISIQNQIVPNYIANFPISSETAARGGINGSLRLNYYLTGADFLTVMTLRNELASISGNLAGVSFKSGFLTSYGISTQPNAPILAQAEIVFFEDLKGSIHPSTNSGVSFQTDKVLHSSNININVTQGIADSVGLTFTNFSWQYKAEIKPEYYAKTQITTPPFPDSIRIGKREVQAQFTTFSEDYAVLYTGMLVNVTVNLKDYPTNVFDPFVTAHEYFLTSGILKSRNLSASVGKPLENTFDIVMYGDNYAFTQTAQNSYPIIQTFSPVFGSNGTLVTVRGWNLSSVVGVSVGGGPTVAPNALANNNYVTFLVPPGSKTGPITLYSENPTSVVTTFVNFTYTAGPITIASFYKTYGNPGDIVRIIGTNFLNGVAQVLFGSTPATKFYVYDDSHMTVTVPDLGDSFGLDYIHIVSTQGQTATSTLRFSAIPSINSLSLIYGIPGDTLVLNGANFHNIVSVSLQGVPVSNLVNATVGSVTTAAVTITVPAHIVEGIVTVTWATDDGLQLKSTSADTFRPIALLDVGFYDDSSNLNPVFGNNQHFQGRAWNLDPNILQTNGTTFTILLNGIRVQAKIDSSFTIATYMAFDATTPVDGNFGGLAAILDSNENPFPNPNGIYMQASLPVEVTSVSPDPIPLYNAFEKIILNGNNLGEFDAGDTAAILISGSWRNLQVPALSNPLSDFNMALFPFSPSEFSQGSIDGSKIVINMSDIPEILGLLPGGGYDASLAPFALCKLCSNYNFHPLTYAYPDNPPLAKTYMWATGYPASIVAAGGGAFEYNVSYDAYDFYKNNKTQIGVDIKGNAILAPAWEWKILGRNLANPKYTPFDKTADINIAYPRNLLTLANGKPNVSLCIGPSNPLNPNDPKIKLWIPNADTMYDSVSKIYLFKFLKPQFADNNYYFWRFKNYDLPNPTVTYPNHVLQDDYIPGSNGKHGFFHEIINDPLLPDGGPVMQVSMHVPYYALELGTEVGRWVYDFNTPQTINFVVLLCQDTYHHMDYGHDQSNELDGTHVKIGTTSSRSFFVLLQNSSGGAIYSLVMNCGPNEGVGWSEFGLSWIGDNGPFVLPKQRAKMTFYQAMWGAPAPQVGVSRIIVYNNTSDIAVLSMVAAY